MLRASCCRRTAVAAFWLAMMAVGGATAAKASNPRWVTGPPYFTTSGSIVIWYTDQPRYYTDPGDLSASVNHAAADAMVEAAANLWNLPNARIVLQQGGTLDEMVSGANVSAGANGPVFPVDAESDNYAAKQIAVIYDRDGSVTDLLLGGGASDPSGCRQNGVTESVDSITPAGLIEHAVLILNGRCTGPAPEQQLQMQYQLERAFGRVLGLGWSQLNDNVFTGTPQATASQALHWPIMHPIDIICGLYTYQCLPQPFTLRDDDIAAMVMLYPVKSGVVPAGKQVSLTQASLMEGSIHFPVPSDEGMEGVNVVIRRNSVPQQVTDTFDDVSAVSGVFMQHLSGNPISPRPTDLEGSLGQVALYYNSDYNFYHDTNGFFRFPWVPLPTGQSLQDMLFRTEPVNPLYTGEYAVGPYPLSSVTPSGNSTVFRVNGVPAGFYGYSQQAAPNAASTCSTGGDGMENAPDPVAANGWWTGLICGSNPYPWYFGHSAWSSLSVRANRSLTVEVTARDEQALATANKLLPVIGLWHGTDAIGTTPGLAAVPVPFNSVALGMTTLTAQSTQTEMLRMAISDARGDGRPDYGYQARVLYADTIAPAVSGAGAQVTITGMGFRTGNTVTVNGVAAKVKSWSSTAIVAVVPFLSGVASGTSLMADVAVSDLSTQGSTVMTAAFEYVYTAPPYSLVLVSGPAGNLPVSLPASPFFVVKALDVDGVTPLAGAAIGFAAITGSVSWGGCGGTICTVLTDANGLASIVVTPSAPGAVTLQAAGLGLTQQISFQAVPLVRSVTVVPSVEYLAAGATASWMATASVLQQGLAADMMPVVWTLGAANARPLTITITGVQATTDAQGSAQATITAGTLVGGAQAAGSVCAWGGVCGMFVAEGVDPSEFAVVPVGGVGQVVTAGGTLAPVSFEITDAAGDPVVGAVVVIHQTLIQWTAPCPAEGRCPVAPVYQIAQTAATSDGSGMVTVMPLQMPDAGVTDIVVTAGTQGFLSFTLQKQP